MNTKSIMKLSAIMRGFIKGFLILVVLEIFIVGSNYSDTPSTYQKQAIDSSQIFILLIALAIGCALAFYYFNSYRLSIESGKKEVEVRQEAIRRIKYNIFPIILIVLFLFVFSLASTYF